MSLGEKALQQRNLVQLNYGQDGTVVVTPRDQDRFALTIEAAIQACALHIETERREATFRLLCQTLGEWQRDRRDSGKITRAILTTRDNSLLFLVIMKEPRFDPELEEELTELELHLADDPQLRGIPVTVMAFPPVADNEALFSFVNPEVVINF
jgi:hypothetical protein